MRYKAEKKPSHTKGETWSPSTIQTIFNVEYKKYIKNKDCKDLALFLTLFWQVLKQEPTYLNDVNIWNLTYEKRRDIFLRGYQMWIMYKTSIDQDKTV